MPHDNSGRYYAFLKAVALSLFDFKEVDGTAQVGNQATAAGGVLASDTTPTMTGVATTESQVITWATSNVDIIATQIALPADFDGTNDVVIDLWVASGTTNLASFTVETSWDNGTLVSTAATDPAQSATIHKISATIPAASVPDAASFVTIQLTPAAHATDTIKLHAARIGYVPKTVAP